MKKTNLKLQPITKDNAGAFAPYILSQELSLILSPNVLAFGYVDDNSACAALVAVIEEDILSIRSIFVAPDYRCNGIGTDLINHAQEEAEKQSLKSISIIYSLPPKELELFDRFLIKNQFAMPTRGDTVFTVDIPSIKNSPLMEYGDLPPEIASNIVLFSELSPQAKSSYFQMVSNNNDSYLAASNAKGEVIPELFYTYVNNEKVQNFIILTKLEGSLHLNSVFISENSGSIILALLKTAYTTIVNQFSDYKTLTITQSSDGSGEKLCNHLLKGTDFWQQTVHMTGKLLWKEQNPMIAPTFEITMPKLDQLKLLLNEDNIESDLIISGEGIPYLLVSLKLSDSTKPVMLRVNYIPLDPDSYTSFLINVSANLPIPNDCADKVGIVCLLNNQLSACGFAYVNPNEPEVIILRATLPIGEHSYEDNFRRFFQLYLTSLNQVLDMFKKVANLSDK